MFNQVEKTIEQVEGVISCRITGDGEKKVDEIHIVADESREPKRIVRDIETIVLVNLDYEVNHKKISIAQINSQEQNQPRRRIELISLYQEHNSSVCHFEVEINGETIEEEIEGKASSPLPLTIAEGLLDIIEHYTNFKGQFRLENVFKAGIKDEIITVQIVLYRQGDLTKKQRLVGSTYINQNLPLATGKACLKALNRQLAAYL